MSSDALRSRRNKRPLPLLPVTAPSSASAVSTSSDNAKSSFFFGSNNSSNSKHQNQHQHQHTVSPIFIDPSVSHNSSSNNSNVNAYVNLNPNVNSHKRRNSNNKNSNNQRKNGGTSLLPSSSSVSTSASHSFLLGGQLISQSHVKNSARNRKFYTRKNNKGKNNSNNNNSAMLIIMVGSVVLLLIVVILGSLGMALMDTNKIPHASHMHQKKPANSASSDTATSTTKTTTTTTTTVPQYHFHSDKLQAHFYPNSKSKNNKSQSDNTDTDNIDNVDSDNDQAAAAAAYQLSVERAYDIYRQRRLLQEKEEQSPKHVKRVKLLLKEGDSRFQLPKRTNTQEEDDDNEDDSDNDNDEPYRREPNEPNDGTAPVEEDMKQESIQQQQEKEKDSAKAQPQKQKKLSWYQTQLQAAQEREQQYQQDNNNKKNQDDLFLHDEEDGSLVIADLSETMEEYHQQNENNNSGSDKNSNNSNNNSNNHDKKQEKEQHDGQEKDNQAQERNATPVSVLDQQQQQQQQQPKTTDKTKPLHDDSTYEKRPFLRTIQTMESKAYHASSSCPPVNKSSNTTTTTTTSTFTTATTTTTLVVQTSLDRAWLLLETCQRRWKTHPIVAVLALTISQQENEHRDELHHLRQTLETECPHLQMEIVPLSTAEDSVRYPVNKLRNIGLQRVQTSHVMVVDVDLLPSIDLDRQIQVSLSLLLQQKGASSTNQRHALVIPAFERVCQKDEQGNEGCYQALKHNSSFVPADFEGLQRCIVGDSPNRNSDKSDKTNSKQQDAKDPSCVVFQGRENWEGHSSTRSGHWMASMMKYMRSKDDDKSKEQEPGVRTLDCFDSLRYEPYVVIPWCTSVAGEPMPPYYDERFYGYGKNKIQYIQHLRFLRYQFSILPRPGFLIHNPHPSSAAKRVWLDNSDRRDIHDDRDNKDKATNLHKDMDQLYPRFLQELATKYFGNEKAFSWTRQFSRRGRNVQKSLILPVASSKSQGCWK